MQQTATPKTLDVKEPKHAKLSAPSKGLELPELPDYERPELEKFEKPEFAPTEKAKKLPQVKICLKITKIKRYTNKPRQNFAIKCGK